MTAAPVRVLVDCDNTLGEYRSEIDDGLAIIMLLAAGVEVVGITTTYGNGPLARVHERTQELLIRLGREDIPVVRGASCSGDLKTPAAAFVASAVGRYGSSLRILAIGPLTNLHAALVHDPALASQVSGIYAMGGYERRLRFLRREVAELNLSADPEAAYAVLTAGWPVTLASAQLCLQARYGLRHLLVDWVRSSAADSAFRRELRRRITAWFLAFSIDVGAAGFYLWDLVPAWLVLDPSRFFHRHAVIMSTPADLKTGTLRLGEEIVGGASPRGCGVIDVPTRIRRGWRFARDCARLWRRMATCREGTLHG